MTTTPKENFGKQIKLLRKKQALSQSTLALMCGVSQGYISRLERGQKNPSLDLIIKIAEALDAPLAELFTFPE